MSLFRWLPFLSYLLITAPLVVSAGDVAVGQSGAAGDLVKSTQVRASRHAVVIGNSLYLHAPPLKNAINDTRAIAAALKELDFDVTVSFNLTGEQMRRTIGEFSRKIVPGDVVLFYYAGHGLQYNDANYLLPVDAAVERASDLGLESQRLGDIIDAIAPEGTTAIIILDACRNNPFIDRLSTSGASRALRMSGGLAEVQAGTGIFIGFASQPGKVAYDGGEENSPFAAAILRHIGTPGVDIEVVMRRVRMDVIRDTAGAQVPWSNSSLLEPGFVFRDAPEGPGQWNSPDLPQSGEKELTFWRSIENETDPNAFKAYLEAFPGGTFEDIAKLRIKKLERTDRTKGANTGGDKPKSKSKTKSATTKTKATSTTTRSTTSNVTGKSKAADSGSPTTKTERTVTSTGGSCREGNLARCRERCAQGRKGACRILQRAKNTQ